MRTPREKSKPSTPRVRIQKADNVPSLVKRIQFWWWNLKIKK